MPKKNPALIEHDIYKHTHHGILAEQIILGNKSCFLQIINDKPIIVDKLELPSQNIVLHPRDRHKISSRIHQFRFNDESEIQRFIEKAKSVNIDNLYYRCKEFWEKLIVADSEEIILLSADTILTFFQDRFVQTHYVMVIGPPGSGKNAIFLTLKFLGYRVVISSNMRSAHILDLLGSTEPCQVTLIEDEFYDIYKDAEKCTIYITGYEADGVTSRTVDAGKPSRHSVDYNTFCLKLVGAEYPPKANERHGLEDRSFQINTHKGVPQYYVKNLLLKKPPMEYKKLLSEIEEFHKLMLIYRMIHSDNDIDIAKTNIDSRALELAGPLINLFSADSLTLEKKARPEILNTLSVFLQKKGKLGQVTLEYVIYQVIKEYCDKSANNIVIISNPDITKAVREKADGKPIMSQEAFYSTMLGRITHVKVYERCRTVLGAEDTSVGTGNDKKRGLLFTKQKITKAESQFKIIDKIQILNNNNTDNVTAASNNNVDNDTGTLGQLLAPEKHRINVCPTTTDQSPASGVRLENAIIDNNNNSLVLEANQPQTELVRENDSGTQLNDGILYKQKDVPSSHSNIQETLGNYIAWDLEWNAHNEITAAAFYDNNNNAEVFLREDLLNESNPERALLETILIKLQEYPTSMGWSTTSSSKYQNGLDADLIHLHNRCEANEVDSIVGFRQNNQPFLPDLTHIDLRAVFDKKIIKDAVFKGGYYNLKLNQVSKFILKEGKYKSLTGDHFNYMPIDEKRKYVLQDAQLVMKLSKHDNYKVLDFMLAIAELCELDLEYVCRTNLTSWWKHVYNKMLENGECGFPTRQFDKSEKWNYTGGKVFDPKQGFYGKYVIVFDAKSLYPSIAILYNISFDTVNCDCCKDDLECQIINPDILKDCKVESKYWICNKNQGALKTKLIVFREERFRQLKLGNDAKQSVLKILINGAYGVFGKDYFYFYDPRVAELITTHGRYMLLKMKELAEQSGFKAIYGDTDSIFIHLPADSIEQVKDLVSGFQQSCENNLHVGIELKSIYSKSIMSKGKKHYVGYGIDDKGKEILDIKGMEGKKRNRPKFVKTIFTQIIDKIFKSASFSHDEIISMVRNAMEQLSSSKVDASDLIRAETLTENPEDYKDQHCAIAKKGHVLKLRKDDTVEWYDSDNEQGWSQNPDEISVQQYKQLLWNSLKEVLELAEFPIEQMALEFGVENDMKKVQRKKAQKRAKQKKQKKDGHDNAQPSRGVAELSNVQQLKQTTVKGGVS